MISCKINVIMFLVSENCNILSSDCSDNQFTSTLNTSQDHCDSLVGLVTSRVYESLEVLDVLPLEDPGGLIALDEGEQEPATHVVKKQTEI